MGDPAGVGPEIALKAVANPRIHEVCRPLLIGDAGVMETARGFAAADVRIRPVADVGAARFQTGTLDVLDLQNVDLKTLRLGQISAAAGDAA
ncbi:MAG: hypothetical protein D6743_04610, partial [Calditrichaeota bacterium]